LLAAPACWCEFRGAGSASFAGYFRRRQVSRWSPPLKATFAKRAAPPRAPLRRGAAGRKMPSNGIESDWIEHAGSFLKCAARGGGAAFMWFGRIRPSKHSISTPGGTSSSSSRAAHRGTSRARCSRSRRSRSASSRFRRSTGRRRSRLSRTTQKSGEKRARAAGAEGTRARAKCGPAVCRCLAASTWGRRQTTLHSRNRPKTWIFSGSKVIVDCHWFLFSLRV